MLGDAGDNVFYPGFPSEPDTHDRISGRGGSDTVTFDSLRYGGGSSPPVAASLLQGEARWAGQGFAGTAIIALSSIENLVGTSDGDSLMGNGRNNRLSGLSGDDSLLGRGGDDVLFGGIGALPDYPEFDEDALSGGGGRDRLYGGVGPDDLNGGPGRDLNYGGADHDYCVSPSPAQGARNCEDGP